MKAEESLSQSLKATRVGGPGVPVVRFACRPLSRVEILRGSVREYFLTFKPDLKLDGKPESSAELYGRIAEFIASVGGDIVQERCYAVPEAYDEIAAARRRAFESHGIDAEGTLCFVGEAPCEGPTPPIAGVQLWVAQSTDGTSRVASYVVDGQPVGRRFKSDHLCYTALACVGPSRELGTGEPRGEHAASMFKEAARFLGGAGLVFRDVIRTWIYVPELLEWYDEFNVARRRVFKDVGLIDDGQARWLPASTGIQGKCPVGRACKMGVLAATRTNGAAVEVGMVASPGQCEAFEYGSAFSRAVEVRDEAHSQMYISGTASIEVGGATVHVGDIEKQVAHTLAVMRDLLGACGHTFKDIAHFTAFLKRPEYLAPFRRVAEREGVDCRLAVETIADVCRDDLLVELEAMSVRRVEAPPRRM
jgi:enamine deaminase RidA (YjgF/YER057c/UK114 family)